MKTAFLGASLADMKTSTAVVVLALVCVAQSSQAAVEYMPSYANILLGNGGSNPPPTDGLWYKDRTAPAGFGTEPACQGRTDVLKISILGTSPSGNAGGTNFYALQGREYGISQQNTGWTLSADLFVESGWASSSNGLRRAELWGVSMNAGGYGAGLPAIGFTNEGSGIGRFRFATGNWNETWSNLDATVNYGAWNSLQLEFDPTANLFKYRVNGVLQASFTSIVPVPSFGAQLGGTSTGLLSTIMQTYNYGQDYSVCWSNTAVPAPGAAALLGLCGLMAARRRR